MNNFPENLIQQLEGASVVAGFSVHDIKQAIPIAEALLEGGITAIELTLRTEVGLEAAAIIRKEIPEMLVGIGTILTTEQVDAVKRLDAHFGVAPGLNPKVVEHAKEIGLPFAPGVATPSDIEVAAELGCRFLKFFPAEASGGIPYLKSMSTPYNHLGIRYFPLGGINTSNMKDYLALDNVSIVGGSWIVNDSLVQEENWSEITMRSKEVINILEKM
jgi:2-dehydro-3-deoxyphosphogluconate aldolase/(4S)-4-hydroxy-2-oxoglutarate aldolase